MLHAPAPPSRIADVWVWMGKTWARIFEFLEASLTPDADSDCAALSTADVMIGPPATASSLDMSISAALEIQRSWGYTYVNASGMMGHDFHNWTLPSMETASWDN